MINIQVENKKFLYQVILFVLFSNLIVYALSFEETKKSPSSVVPATHYEIIATLNLLTPFKKNKKVLLSHSKNKVLIKDVYLIKKLSTQDFVTRTNNKFVIKVSPTDIHHFSALKKAQYDVYPANAHISYQSHKKKRIYEIFY